MSAAAPKPFGSSASKKEDESKAPSSLFLVRRRKHQQARPSVRLFLQCRPQHQSHSVRLLQRKKMRARLHQQLLHSLP
ncbi:hypothetical protein ACHAW6_014807 [Cyclotella cf. meneghiniana]